MAVFSEGNATDDAAGYENCASDYVIVIGRRQASRYQRITS